LLTASIISVPPIRAGASSAPDASKSDISEAECKLVL
jgi:hypothetical protein